MWEGSVWILMDPYGPVWVRMVPGDSLPTCAGPGFERLCFEREALFSNVQKHSDSAVSHKVVFLMGG